MNRHHRKKLGDFMKYSHSKAMAVFHKIVKLVKNGVLMIIYIYAKVSKGLKMTKQINTLFAVLMMVLFTMGTNTLMHDSVIINCHATQNKCEDHPKLAKINAGNK
jgi:hypothetical protein